MHQDVGIESVSARHLARSLLEAAHTISSRTRGVEVKLHGREMSHFVVVEYAVKMMCYCAMATKLSRVASRHVQQSLQRAQRGQGML